MDKILNDLAYAMIRIRKVEEKIDELNEAEKVKCPTHLCVGQEAIAVGVGHNLLQKDYVFSTYRGHGHYLAKGGDLKKMMAEILGSEKGCCKGRGGSMHIVDPDVNFMGTSALVGGCLPAAVGTAWASQMKNEKRVTAVFFGDGAVEEGIFHESMNFASLKKLPIIFVCENNFYAVNSPIEARQPLGADIYKRAEGYRMKGYLVDGNNVLDVNKIAKELIDNARNGDGPSLLEARTFRWCVHVQHYNETLKRKEELINWQKRCPIKNLGFSSLEIVKMSQKINLEIEELLN
ncbi:TPA: dehydrogenase [Patescibacteria group bacterium]|nr:MAG: Pyruvate dehydrogenase (Lipoamide) [Parcubacteria group bacterium GW2011_GWF2_40_10]KKR46911.1 MAG: Pyruvate dehydrogenase (Lipoamide) [Parcubacteria group bacterium GW2011_GWA2_40_143]KKR58898.1 MAG: Pyruvate dehydrogenase (Lipoamide) [Parcubacteria group bacterium GW2011_GWC2_40_31]KKR75185.1 MAG: Pyruvate dehydrogenase (Lipoamide) [Parcubacteria group bacterium GW2011_GWB2_40_8]KKR77737.1 MAG: Pyruvate dehydrogenase (Lipoamide) [Parcubacteria group bacterium GW2011_GWE2_40_8]KKR8328